MIFVRTILLLSLYASFSSAQDTIRGTYSYTYGDSESLVEARQTCKELTIREAIESYYIFVESSTNVENYQVIEDIIQSIAAGFLKDVQVVEQTEEGRTITMTVEAKVIPDEVKQLVENLALTQEKEKPSELEDSLKVETTTSLPDSNFITALWEYEKRIKSTEKVWAEKKFDNASNQFTKLQSFIEKYEPVKNNRFQWLMYQSIRNRTDLLKDLLRVEYLESKGKRIRARANMRSVLKKSRELKSYMERLEKLTHLTDKQDMIRKACMSRCRFTLSRVKKKSVKYRKR